MPEFYRLRLESGSQLEMLACWDFNGHSLCGQPLWHSLTLLFTSALQMIRSTQKKKKKTQQDPKKKEKDIKNSNPSLALLASPVN